MTDTPPDWVLIEAAKRSGLKLNIKSIRPNYPIQFSKAFRALCDMIKKYEQPPVDCKLLCAQAALTDALIELDLTYGYAEEIRAKLDALGFEIREKGQ
jgi:hypothetical protein